MDSAQPDVLQSTQIGIEATKGTPVTANLLLKSVTLVPKPVEPTEMKRSRGSKIDDAQVGQKGAMTQAALTGYQSFVDLVILYYSIFGIPISATAAAGCVDLTWLLKARKKDDTRAFTVETGSDDGGNRFSYGSLTDIEQAFTKQNCDMTGTMIGRRLAEEGVVMTASPTEVPNVPFSPDLFDAYAGSTLASLTTEDAHLLDFLEGRLTIGERRAALFALQTNQASFSTLVEKPNTATAHFELVQGSTSNTLMYQLRKRGTRYARLFATGPEIVAGYNYEWDARFPFKVNNPDRGPKDEVYGGIYDLNLVNDSTLGGFLKIRMRVPSSISTLVAPGTALSGAQSPDTLLQTAATTHSALPLDNPQTVG